MTFLKLQYRNHEYFTDHDNALETLADLPWQLPWDMCLCVLIYLKKPNKTEVQVTEH